MNIDLLIKLVKLANNNPSEHEANSAARRACKLIAEGNYKFGAEPPKQPKVEIRQPQPWPGNASPFTGFHNTDWFTEFYNNQRQERQNEYERQQAGRENERREQQARNQQNVYGGQGYNPNQYYKAPYSKWDIPDPKKPKIRRDCSKCGLNVETNNTKEVFVCTVCIWKAYMEEQNAKKNQNDQV